MATYNEQHASFVNALKARNLPIVNVKLAHPTEKNRFIMFSNGQSKTFCVSDGTRGRGGNRRPCNAAEVRAFVAHLGELKASKDAERAAKREADNAQFTNAFDDALSVLSENEVQVTETIEEAPAPKPAPRRSRAKK